MAEGFDYEFKAPMHYFDLHNHDDDDAETFFATPSCTPEANPERKYTVPKVEVDAIKNMPVEANAEREATAPKIEVDAIKNMPVENLRDTPKKHTPSKAASSRLDFDSNGLPSEFPMRHSPRLAAIAKAVRRSNANRGIVDSTHPTIERNHRRSLSEGAIITKKFTKVKKQPISRKASVRVHSHEANAPAFSQHDLSTLSEISNLSETRTKKTKTLKVTMPIEFIFATDSRVKNKNVQDTEDSSADYFVRSLRSHTAQSGMRAAPRGPTKVEPFKFHSQGKSQDTNVQPFVSLAELNMKYLTKTPLRYRTKRSNSADREQPPKKDKGDNRLTVPRTPQLSCRTRSRPVLYPSREEEEEREVQEARKYQFKAQPVDKRIYDHPPVQLPERKKSTLPPNKEPQGLMSNFKALSTASLASIPHCGIPGHWEKRSTHVEPFSFDARDSEALRRKKEKIQKLIEEERKAAEFHAHPMPIFDQQGSKGLPPKKPPTPTRLRPFNLYTDIRGTARQELIKKEMEELEELEREQRAFHAQPDTVLFKPPFLPEKSKKPLTDISGFSLNTEKRSKERHDFDLLVKQKEGELQAMKKEKEERKMQEEEEEVARMRREAVHKAQPILKSKPFVVKRGVLPVTQPISPEFLTTNRISQRAASNMNIDTTLDEFNRDSTYTTQ